MPSNSLTRDMGLKVGPLVLGTFIKHYFDRVKSRETADSDELLKQDEILYDEAFHVIKAFLHESTFHTVEELQGFSNTQTPPSPYTHILRVLVPLSSCNEAAHILVKVLGGEDKTREIIGGVKWWQVRGIEGIDAQWITAKKGWREAKSRHRAHRTQAGPVAEDHQPQASGPSSKFDSSDAHENMDEMRCILYLHGGGYYFGSVDQQRYSIQRHARKINGRVFAINYRLAPQYPFPCGLHDALAAYLYLIRPPPEADHLPIDPAHIVIAGDSAGGGMSLALLQLLRDAGLPLPAGGLLISPWCDLTHSFPSIHTNTPTDIIPPTGLSFHKPSLLWPPPPHEVSSHVHASVRQKLRRAFKMDDGSVSGKIAQGPARTSTDSHLIPAPDMPVNVGENIPVPPVDAVDPQRLILVTEGGEQLEINKQVHFYAQNSLLVHPYVSPGLGYLGGLPPLFFVASDKEVLRDEIIFTAHRAANPHRHPLKDQTKGLYPLSEGVQERHPQPTSVHLQVYDGTCHILPVLFLFSTPAKFCFRAMASFIKFVTGMPPGPPVSPSDSSLFSLLWTGRRTSSPEIQLSTLQEQADTVSADNPEFEEAQPNSTNTRPSEPRSASSTPFNASNPRKKSLRRSLSLKAAMTGGVFHRWAHSGYASSHTVNTDKNKIVGHGAVSELRYAGESSVYQDIKDRTFEMIRERVSTQGVLRPLEPESELDAFTVPEELIGTISELAIRRYMHGEILFRRKYAKTYKDIEKTREKNLKRMTREESKRFDVLRASSSNLSHNGHRLKLRENVLNSPGWGYAWALDELEKPPPSSIVARRDTEEARKLAIVADRAVLEEVSELNPNSLWSAMMNILTPPDRLNGNEKDKMEADCDGDQVPGQERILKQEKEKGKEAKTGRTFPWILFRRKSSISV